METSGLNGGTMIATSYVLGKKNGEAYLIVQGEQVLAPGASSFLGMQWAE